MARRAIIEVVPEMLVTLMLGHPMEEVTSNIPADMKIIDIELDRSRSGEIILIVVESTSFDDVPNGGILPTYTAEFSRRISELDALYQILRPIP